MISTDFVIIGAGIVGAATALALKRRLPTASITLIEKEARPAVHQTGRNSGVVHAGVYYPPNSLKAQLCREGLHDTLEFCQKNSVPLEQCGKLIVATTNEEVQRLNELEERCRLNRLNPIRLSQQRLHQYEPNITGLEGLLIKDTSITDYVRMTEVLLEKFTALGGKCLFNYALSGFQAYDTHTVIEHPTYPVKTGYLVNCAGIMTDRIAKSFGIDVDFQMLPFMGQYYQLHPRFNQVFSHLIYPVPDPNLPFLGVHITKMIDGSVTVGPNAVLVGDREGESPFALNLKDAFETISYPGLWRLLSNYPGALYDELKTAFSKRAYLRQVQKYCPSIALSDLQPYRSGIRAQAVGRDGSLIHDFKFIQSKTSLHVGNAPSPAATSALPIARTIVDRITQ